MRFDLLGLFRNFLSFFMNSLKGELNFIRLDGFLLFLDFFIKKIYELF